MASVICAARFLLSLDSERKYFNKKLHSGNGRKFYEENARLNKMLHLAHNIYIGKTGTPLFDTLFYAFDNGGVSPEVQDNYAMLLATSNDEEQDLNEELKVFLTKVFLIYKDAPIDELIDIDHEDPAWIDKHHYYYKADQVMDSLKYKDDYKSRYADINECIEEMIIP